MNAAFRRLWPKSLAGKALVVFGFAVLLIVVLWFVALFVMQHRLATAMKRAETEFGFSNRIEDLLPVWLPAGLSNAAIPLDKAAEIVAPIMQALPNAAARDDVGERLTANPGLIDKIMSPEIDALLAEADKRSAYLPTAPISRPWLNSTPQRPRRLLMESEAIVVRHLADAGNAEGAVRRALRSLRIGRKWVGKEAYFSDAVSDISRRYAFLEGLNRVLRSSSLSAELHAEIERELAEQDRVREVLPLLIHIEKLKRLEDFHDNPFRQRAWWVVGPIADNDRLFIIEWHDPLMRTCQRPRIEVQQELEAASEELWRISKHPIDRLLHPDSLGVLSHQQRSGCDYLVAVARCLRIINAMAARNAWDPDPQSLGLPKDCLVDPNTGTTPLVVKKTTSGPLVYSVGFDFKDNGGTFDSKTIEGMDIGLGPSKPSPTKSK